MSDSSVPKLYYFDFCGRAEAIRLAFVVGHIEFEDFRFPIAEWVPKYKQITPAGHVPMLVIGDRKYCESTAILMYAAKTARIVPDDPVQLMTMWQAIRALEDTRPIAVPVLLAEPGKKDEIRAVQSKLLIPMLEKYEKLVSIHQHSAGFLVGDSLSPADLNLYGFLRHCYSPVIGFDSSLTHTTPALQKVYDLVDAIPAVQKWYSKK